MDNNLKSIVIGVLSFIAGMFIYSKFFVPEFTTTVIEKTTTDTTFQHYKIRYKEDSLKWASKSDSIDYFREKYEKELRNGNVTIVHDSVFVDKPFEAPLRRYTGMKPHLYGNSSYNLLVAGSMLDIEISNDFDIPTITNTITKEVRSVVKPSGLYATFGARAGEQLSPLIGATYLKDKVMIFYNYDIKFRSSQAGIGVRVLGK